jgi:hypothetical protein
MNSKIRIADLEVQRNGLTLASLGDKPYRNPDYSKDYFKDGGLVPG